MTTVTDITTAIEADPEAVGISASRLEYLSRCVQGHIDARRIPGAITAVARRGKVVHFKTYGSMDDEAGKPMRPDTIFRIYSMTKPIVSLALMQLYEEGRFQLDDPASRYIPEFKGLQVFDGGTAEDYRTRPASREMTIGDLLRHTSGLTSRRLGPGPASPVQELYQRAKVQGVGSEGTLQDEVARLARLPLQVDPGAEWIYGVSTNVVGYLCEVLSGRPLDQFLDERIFKPLAMPDTSFYVPPAKLDRFAACYRPAEGKNGYVLQDSPANSSFSGAGTFFSGVGGLCGTAGDYVRFAMMLANGGELDGVRIIGRRTLEFMTLNHLPGGVDRADISQPLMPGGPQQRGTGFGLGFAVVLDPAAAQLLGSPGEYSWSGAASTQFFVSPRDDLAVVFMTQLMAPPGLYTFGRDIRVTTYQALID